MKSCTLLALVVAELALFAVACSSKSSPPASYVPHKNAGTGGSKATDSDASTCKTKTGYEQVNELDADTLADDGNVALAIGVDGSPMVAWVAFGQSATTLYFSSYDTETCQWRPRLAVADLGTVSATRGREVTMTRDPSNGQLGIAYQVVDNSLNRAVMLAQSGDNGATWSSEMIARNPTGNTSNGVARPTVVMKDGTTYFAYYQMNLYSSFGTYQSDNGGFVLLNRAGTSGQFTSTNVPAVGDTNLPGNEPFPPSLAIDDHGEAGLAYFALTDTTGDNLRLAYYHTARTMSVAVFDSQQQPNDVAEVSLIFEGDSPRVAASLERGTSDASRSMIWFSASEDGTSWSIPVELPMDGLDSMGPDVSMASDGAQTLAVAANYGTGAGSSHQCGAPKISTSTDEGTSWSTCGPALSSAGSITHAGRTVQLAFQPSGKLLAAFAAEHLGVWVWREP